MTLVHATYKMKIMPDWAKLSTELQAVIRAKEPTPMGDGSRAHQTVHDGKNFNLHGLTFRAYIKNSFWRGVRFNPHIHRT